MAVKSDAAVFPSFRVKRGIRKRRMMTDVAQRGGQKIDGGNSNYMWIILRLLISEISFKHSSEGCSIISQKFGQIRARSAVFVRLCAQATTLRVARMARFQLWISLSFVGFLLQILGIGRFRRRVANAFVWHWFWHLSSNPPSLSFAPDFRHADRQTGNEAFGQFSSQIPLSFVPTIC